MLLDQLYFMEPPRGVERNLEVEGLIRHLDKCLADVSTRYEAAKITSRQFAVLWTDPDA